MVLIMRLMNYFCEWICAFDILLIIFTMESRGQSENRELNTNIQQPQNDYEVAPLLVLLRLELELNTAGSWTEFNQIILTSAESISWTDICS